MKTYLLALGLLLTGCASHVHPNVSFSDKERIVMGSFIAEGISQTTPRAPYMYVSRLDLAKMPDGKIAVVKQGYPKMYILKSFGDPWPDYKGVSYYVPFRPGVYAIRSLKFNTLEYAGGMGFQKEYQMDFGNGIPFVVSDKPIATNLGRMVVKVESTDLKKRTSTGSMDFVADNETKARFLAVHPGYTIVDSIPQKRPTPESLVSSSSPLTPKHK